MKIRKLLLPLLLFSSMSTQAGEKAVYVGEGRYVCEADSVDCAVLKQRNQEQARRLQERHEDEQRYDREERREAEYQREYETGDY